MKSARGLLIFSYGLFTIAAQTLLFREFVTAFEGNDISVGIFFGSWFLWVGSGAVLVRRWGRFAEVLSRRIELLCLAYIPAFVAQLLLIVHVRELAGAASYDLMSVQTVVFWSLAVNAPVSLVTGMLFPVACRWVEKMHTLPVSHVYVLEALGSLAGGLGVTVLLAFHVQTARIFCVLALVLLFSVCVVGATALLAGGKSGSRHSRGYHGATVGVSLALALLTGIFVLTGVDDLVARRLRVLKWAQLLPREGLRGAFHTAQAEYLYGAYRGQWIVVRQGGVCEALPNEAAAGRAAAVSLCQVPQARRVLVIGSGLALCERLLELPQLEHVAWTHADGEYVGRVNAFVPDELRIQDARFEPVAQEVRSYLRSRGASFDLVVLNLPDVTSSVFNRYYTTEFYEQIRDSLRAGGVLSVSVAGGENVMGAELVNLGASVKVTLEKVFSNVVLVPGDETWFIVSQSPQLSGDPAILRDRFASIEGAAGIFPPTGLLSVYLPDRAARALERYAKADLPEALLVNRDARPLTHLYSLLLAARQSGAMVTQFVKLLALTGLAVFVVPMALYVALRLWFMIRERPGDARSSFDASFLLFSTGSVGIGVIIVLMYLYQTRFGSLYLHVGVISSLFMAGLTAGAWAAGCFVARSARAKVARGSSLHGALIAVVSIHAVLLAVMALWFAQQWTGPTGVSAGFWGAGRSVFVAAFVLCGLCSGCYWPLAAAQLSAGGFNPGEAGSRLETADHLGACVGGLVTSLLMVPVLGTMATLLVLIGLVVANLPAALVTSWRRDGIAAAPIGGLGLRKVGYMLFGLGACVVVCSDILTAASARLQPVLPDYAVRTLAGEKHVLEIAAVLDDGGQRVRYFEVSDPNGGPAGHILSSADFAPQVRGFGGKINLAIYVDDAGTLIDLLIVQSNETPSYLELLRGWLDSLKGRRLFRPAPFAGVTAVTGATVSSEAILAALEKSAERFAVEVLGRSIAETATQAGVGAPQPARWTRYTPDVAALYLVCAFAAALLATLWGGSWSRLAVLVVTFSVGGIMLNAQYSTEQIATLLSLHAPAAQMTGVFLLAVAVPLLVILFGNLYCGYVCPFGALQELLGFVVPQAFKPAVRRREMRLGRFVKYVVLFVLIAAFFLSRRRITLSGDPLISVFSFRPSVESFRSVLSGWPGWMLLVVGVALMGSLFYVRFWCRYLCPVGAFLSLLNHVRLLQRWMPAKRFGKCEFGLTLQDHLDCVYCDRCRHPAKSGAQPQARTAAPDRAEATALARPLVLATVLLGLLVAGVSLNEFRTAMPTLVETRAAGVSSGGQPRDVDIRQIQTLINQGRLSDKEAQFYKKVGTEDADPETLSGEGN